MSLVEHLAKFIGIHLIFYFNENPHLSCANSADTAQTRSESELFASHFMGRWALMGKASRVCPNIFPLFSQRRTTFVTSFCFPDIHRILKMGSMLKEIYLLLGKQCFP